MYALRIEYPGYTYTTKGKRDYAMQVYDCLIVEYLLGYSCIVVRV